MDREPQPRDIVVMPDATRCDPEAVVSVSAGSITLRGLVRRQPTRTIALPEPELIQHAGYLSPQLV
jgi:hypothetical protein